MAATRRIAMEECASVDLAALKAAGALCDGKVMRATQEWHHDKKKIARFTIAVDLSGASDAPCLRISGWAFDKAVYQRVALVALPMRFGGRKWFILYTPRHNYVLSTTRHWHTVRRVVVDEENACVVEVTRADLGFRRRVRAKTAYSACDDSTTAHR